MWNFWWVLDINKGEIQLIPPSHTCAFITLHKACRSREILKKHLSTFGPLQNCRKIISWTGHFGWGPSDKRHIHVHVHLFSWRFLLDHLSHTLLSLQLSIIPIWCLFRKMLLAAMGTDIATLLAAHVDALSRWSSLMPRYDSPEGKSPMANGSHLWQPSVFPVLAGLRAVDSWAAARPCSKALLKHAAFLELVQAGAALFPAVDSENERCIPVPSDLPSGMYRQKEK